MQITRADFVKEFQQTILIDQRRESIAREAAQIIQTLLENALINGDRIELRGFGSFGVKHRRAREGRNPLTGEQIQVERRCTVFFKAGRELRLRVRDSVLLKEANEG